MHACGQFLLGLGLRAPLQSSCRAGLSNSRHWPRQPHSITMVDPNHEMSSRDTVILLERLWRKSGER
jgi:hypothetical protein